MSTLSLYKRYWGARVQRYLAEQDGDDDAWAMWDDLVHRYQTTIDATALSPVGLFFELVTMLLDALRMFIFWQEVVLLLYIVLVALLLSRGEIAGAIVAILMALTSHFYRFVPSGQRALTEYLESFDNETLS